MTTFPCFLSIGKMAEVCMICGRNDGVLVEIGKRLATLIDASKLRNDNRYTAFESNSRGLVHDNCASAYIESAFNEEQGLSFVYICPSI